MSDQEFRRTRREVFQAFAVGKSPARLLKQAAKVMTAEQWAALSAEIDTWFAAQGIK